MNIKPPIQKLSLIASLMLSAILAQAEQEGDFTYSIQDKSVIITKYTGKGGTVIIPEKIADLPVTVIGGFASSEYTKKDPSITSVKIPLGIVEISYEAFHNCTGLTEISIPSSVREVGTRAFLGCENLAKVTFEPGIMNIGTNAFQDLTKLTDVWFPSSIKNFESMAFYGCKNLASATFEGKAPSLSNKNEFSDAASDFKIRYFKDDSGFTTPEWNGYKTVKIDAATEQFKWESGDGRSLKGKFVKLDLQTVVVQKDDGKEVTIPFAKLSSASLIQAKSLAQLVDPSENSK